VEGEALVEEVVPLRVGSLFTGVGGMDLGLECAGMEVAWQVEIDPYCRQVLKHRWPGVTRYEDVMHVGSEELEPVDLICGGFPCQDVSVAGRREGLAGERSGLFHELMRIARALAPHWLLTHRERPWPSVVERRTGHGSRPRVAGRGRVWVRLPRA